MAMAAMSEPAFSQDSELKGTIIGTQYSVDYSTGNASETVNAKSNAFDGDLNTIFASYDRSHTWLGFDLGKKYVITKVAYASRANWAQRMQLGVFEGANNPDFTDAVPLYMIKDVPQDNTLITADVNVSRGFRYVRYMGPNNVRCNVAELKFYGHEGEGDDSHFYTTTNLPLVVIHTDSAKEITSKEIYTPGIISIISDGGESFYSDSLDIRGRGNASWSFPKKPYKIKLYNKKKLLGMPAKAKKWTLISNYGDKTLIRNVLAFKISELMGMEYTPACRLVDVIFNGEYQGTYQLCDQIEVHKNRVDVTEMTADDNSLPNLSGGYLVEIDAYADAEPKHFSTTSYNLPVTIKSPDSDEITNNQYTYVKNQMSLMASRVESNYYNHPTLGFRKYLDETSFLKHFLVGELSGNTDTYWSVYMYKDRDSTRFHTGPVWDFDIAFENDSRTHPISNISTYLYASDKSSCVGNMRTFVTRIINVDDSLLKYIWSEARLLNGLTLENLNSFLDSLQEEIDESQELNFIRWPILNTQVHQNYQALGSYEKEMQVVRDYLAYRMPWMDDKVGLIDVGIESAVLPQTAISTYDGNISVSGIAQGSTVSIYDISGIKIYSGVASGSSMTVKAASGVYVVRVENSQGSASRKIVVE